ncbi:uncharacterized protein LOC135394515 [Ornithodoros turicata]|uniref:uncharacterized protein LOC135394515 n=1 Tax=Ornithodoros turicata TaxID=34597 RepID=UPI0031392657
MMYWMQFKDLQSSFTSCAEDVRGLLPSDTQASTRPYRKRNNAFWSHDNKLPEFSSDVQPLLYGVNDDRDHTRLCCQLRDEIIRYLDEHQLILCENKMDRRWQYDALGETLVTTYPHMRLSSSNSPGKNKFVWTDFITKLSTTRKMRRVRRRKGLRRDLKGGSTVTKSDAP